MVPAAFWPTLLDAEIDGTDLALWDRAIGAMREAEVPVPVGMQAKVGAARAAAKPGIATGRARCWPRRAVRRP